jgi:nucleoside-diphosphate-sugar epimerase
VTRELLQGRAPTLHSNGEQRRDYVFLDDVVAMNLACMTHPSAPGQTFNVASGRAHSVNELYDIIARTIGTPIKPQFRAASRFWDAYPSLFQGTHPMDVRVLEKEVEKFTLGSVQKAQEVLDWTAHVPIEQGLRETVEYTRRSLALA